LAQIRLWRSPDLLALPNDGCNSSRSSVEGEG
jgi:hypothetical protein